jgi:chromosome segregation ATPase
MVRIRHACASLLVALAASGLLGCDKKVEECNTVIDKINASVEKLKKAEKAPSGKPEEMAKDLKAYAEVAKAEAGELAKIEVTTAELQKYVDEYQTMAEEVAEAALEVATASETLAKMVGDLEKIQKDWESKMKDVQEACTSPAGECGTVMKQMTKIPTGSPDDKKYADELEKWGKGLEGIEIKDEKLKTAVAAFAKVAKDQAGLVRKMKEAETKGDGAMKKLDKATDKEDPLVNKINAFCGAG